MDSRHKTRSLWTLAVAPLIWAGHFLATYVTAAIWCAKIAGSDGSLGGATVAIATYTAAALTALGLVARRAWSRGAGSTSARDRDAPADSRRFLALATLLLSGLSAIAVAWAALVPVFVRSCR